MQRQRWEPVRLRARCDHRRRRPQRAGRRGVPGAGGRTVTVLEARDTLGGAVAGAAVFPGVDARLSRFAYLVSLLPEKIVADLGLDLELRSRPIRSYTPVGDTGVLVRRSAGDQTALDRALSASPPWSSRP